MSLRNIAICHVGHIGFSSIHLAAEAGRISPCETLIIYDTDNINQSKLAQIINDNNLEITVEPRPIHLTRFPEPEEINMLFKLRDPNDLFVPLLTKTDYKEEKYKKKQNMYRAKTHNYKKR